MNDIRMIVIAVSAAVILAACATTGDVQTPEIPSPSAVDWPEEMLTNDGDGAALFIGESSRDAAVGYISAGVRVQITGPGTADRVPVRITGPLKVRGFLRTSRLALRVQQRGRVQGSPGYVGPGNLVTVLGPGDSPDTMRIAVEPRLSDGTRIGPFVGTFATDALGVTDPPADAAAPSAGAYHVLPANREVEVFDRRDGSVITTLPARPNGLVVQVVRDRDGWKGVRIGSGPYISGWINVPTAATATGAGVEGGVHQGIPQRIQRDVRDRPLWRIADRARVRFPTVENPNYTFGILAAQGYAIELARHESEGRIDAFIAVDNDIAIRGLVDIDQLTPVED